MGAYVYAIPVQPTESLLESAKRPKPAGLRRLLRFGTKEPTWKEWDWNKLVAQIDMPRIGKPLLDDFVAFIRQTIPNPWPGTEASFGYLEGSHNVWVRGHREVENAPYQFQVEMTYSCGECGTSSELAAHWCEIWFKRNRDRIFADRLIPNGLDSDEGRVQSATPWHLFLPLGEFGYAALFDEVPVQATIEQSDQGWERFSFCVDEWVTELDPDRARVLLQHLESRGLELMEDRRCRCQLCMPDFDPAELALPSLKSTGR